MSEQSMAQVSLKAILLGIILAVVLAGANAYLGLFAGMTVSASIPAAVISMGILRLFKNATILENNIVQTTASAGEAVAAGVIFTVPALYLIGFWQDFDYWWVTTIAGLGGVLGVLFSVPLRRALIVEQQLPFPEGVATAEVLKAGDSGAGVKYLAGAGVAGGLAKFCEVGLHLWNGTAEAGAYVGRSVLYFGTNVSPALLAVGFIVGLNIAIVVFSGGALAWYVLVPIFSGFPNLDPSIAHFASTHPSAVDLGYKIWNDKIRYIGVGSMLIGGVWSLIDMRGSLLAGIKSASAASKHDAGFKSVPATDRDVPMKWIFTLSLLMVIPIYFLYNHIVPSAGIAAAMAVIMVVTGFLFSAVSSYMAGLVGSSNNPTSGMTIATLLFASLVLLAMLGEGGGSNGPAAAIMIGAVVCCAAAIGGDNLQDLKAGYLIGATPWKQEVMLAVGAIVSALVMAPVLNLLLHAYGLGPATPEHPNSLTAPQAVLMSSVANGVFHRNLPWDMVSLGIIVGAVVIAVDKWLAHRGSSFRIPVLAAAIGIYLPLELTTPILLGGILAHMVKVWNNRHSDEEGRTHNNRHGTLFAAGLITGEALIGIVMAIPIVMTGDRDVIALASEPWGGFPGLLVVALIAWLLYKVGTEHRRA